MTAAPLGGRRGFFSGGTVEDSAELQRILALPRRDSEHIDQQLVDDFTSVLKTPNGKMRLLPIQALALYEIATFGGGFVPVAVGGGKTIISLLAPYVLDAFNPMLIGPAGLIDKTKREWAKYAEHWRIPNSIRLFSYETLGRAEWANELENWKPDVLIFDEAHKLKNFDAAVTKRVLRYLEMHPDTIVVAMSGTMMDGSLHDFGHILKWCLKGRAPVPLDDWEFNQWALALDVKAPRGNDAARFEPGALEKLATGVPSAEAERHKVTRARLGFQARIRSTHGVISSSAKEDINASIHIRGIVYAPTDRDKDPAQNRFLRLRKELKLTDDWALELPLEVWAKAREMALDLSYHWDPRPPEWWREPRKAFSKFVRNALKRSSEIGGELDSPYQVEAAIRDGVLKGGIPLLDAWLAVKDKFVPNVVPVWHDDLALKACAKWAKAEPGVIWTEHSLFARRLSKETGLKYYGEQGFAPDGEYIEDANPKKSVIASIDANKEGRNIQDKWARCLYTAPTERPKDWQQSIGRFHRRGQKADEIEVDVLIGCLEHLNAWRRLIPGAEAVRDTTGAEQKVLIADVKYWPSEFEIASWTGARWGVFTEEEEADFDPTTAPIKDA